MKNIFTFTCLLSLICDSSLFGDNSIDIAKYNKYFSEIGEIRIGISSANIEELENPFIVVALPSANQTDNVSAPIFKLNAIFENKVKINDSWLTKGSAIGGMKVINIKQQSVVIGNENKVIELFLREKNANSIITTN